AVCAAAGIRFMATGGIGGGHPGFAESLDISRDLPPVAATPGIVGCAAAEAARIAAAHWQLAGPSGLLLARPPVDGLDLEALVAEAVDQVASEGITGQAVTPAILTRVEELSGGRSIEVNQRLIADNAT